MQALFRDWHPVCPPFPVLCLSLDKGWGLLDTFIGMLHAAFLYLRSQLSKVQLRDCVLRLVKGLQNQSYEWDEWHYKPPKWSWRLVRRALWGHTSDLADLGSAYMSLFHCIVHYPVQIISVAQLQQIAHLRHTGEPINRDVLLINIDSPPDALEVLDAVAMLMHQVNGAAGMRLKGKGAARGSKMVARAVTVDWKSGCKKGARCGSYKTVGGLWGRTEAVGTEQTVTQSKPGQQIAPQENRRAA